MQCVCVHLLAQGCNCIVPVHLSEVACTRVYKLTCVVTEMNRVHGIHIKAKELQWKDSALVAHVPMHYVTLNAQYAGSTLMHATSGSRNGRSYGRGTTGLGEQVAAL